MKSLTAQRLTNLMTHRVCVLPALLVPLALFVSCGGPPPLAVDMPLHLEEHLDAATIVGSEVPAVKKLFGSIKREGQVN